jgi:hypothetical protein
MTSFVGNLEASRPKSERCGFHFLVSFRDLHSPHAPAKTPSSVCRLRISTHAFFIEANEAEKANTLPP